MRKHETSCDPIDLLQRCESALVAAARSEGAASRQRARAAARHFVRRHRRDTSYLQWVLRCVAASAAMAVALLGLGAEPASAKSTLFRVALSNPLGAFDVGAFSTIVSGDLDADGDSDFVASKSFSTGAIHYFENTGSPEVAALIERTGVANPFNTLNAGATPRLALGDVDGDGDLDLISGQNSSYGLATLFFENTGSATNPTFVQRTGLANPFGAISGLRAAPSLADLDQDGDLDLVMGTVYGVLRYFENTGDTETPLFLERTGGANPLSGLNPGNFANLSLGDLDCDGDFDLVAGEEPLGQFHYFENTGTAIAAIFIARTGAANPLDGQDVGRNSAPDLVDLDADGDLDLVSGNQDGVFLSYENRSGEFIARTGAANPLNDFNVGPAPFSTQAGGDLDADGDSDIVAGKFFDGSVHYFRNTGTASSPSFSEITGAANPFNTLDAGNRTRLALGDVDGDGDLDLVGGASYGAPLHYFRNSGTPVAPAFSEITGTANPFNGAIEVRSAPALGDLNADGDLDLVVGEAGSIFHFYENSGTPMLPAYIKRTGTANPLNGFTTGGFATPALGDVDNDGDLDVAAGDESLGQFRYFENTGSRVAAAFVQRTGNTNPLDGEDVGAASAPAFVEIDADGDPDLFSGELNSTFFFFENPIMFPSPRYFGPMPSTLDDEDVGSFSAITAGDLDGDGDPDFIASQSFATGGIHYFENTRGALIPSVVERTGVLNPFDGLDAGFTPRLVLGDIDADGDLDLISGQNAFYGLATLFFENTGSATSPAFVARTGIANPFGAIFVQRASPAFADLDQDGDLDLVMGEVYGALHYFENTGDAELPVFVERTGGANPLNGLNPGNFSNPSLADVDCDGDLDLIAGEESPGQFHYFENTGTAEAAVFIARTGSANPLDGEDVGLNSSPALVDLDADCDPDMVSGNQDGGFLTYYLPEPGSTSLLAAGASLLAWLSRWRSRRRSG